MCKNPHAVFSKADVGSVFWVGESALYVRGVCREIGTFTRYGLSVGCVGVVRDVEEQQNGIVLIVLLKDYPGCVRLVLNPPLLA